MRSIPSSLLKHDDVDDSDFTATALATLLGILASLSNQLQAAIAGRELR